MVTVGQVGYGGSLISGAVRERDPQRYVHRLAPRGREEGDRVQGWQELRDFTREVQRTWMDASKQGRAAQLHHSSSDRFYDYRVAVSQAEVPQPGVRVEELAAVHVLHPNAMSALSDDLLLGVEPPTFRGGQP